MVPPIDSRGILRKSIPVAVILLFWVGLSSFVQPVIATGLVYGGVIMALLYTVVHGIRLARTQPAIPQPDNLKGILWENVRVAFHAGVWFLAAYLVYAIEQMWDTLGIPGLDTSPAAGLAFVFTGAGVAVVLLYAIMAGLARTRGEALYIEDDATGATPADD